MSQSGRYLESTRHPWSCTLFVLPLLVVYEGGLLMAGQSPERDGRTGSETWLRHALATLGFPGTYTAPMLVALLLLLWSFTKRQNSPRDYLGTWIGMLVESTLFALGLYVVSQAFLPLLDGLGIILQTAGETGPSLSQPSLSQLLNYLGTGIYEETLFRLVLFSALCQLFLLGDFPAFVALNLAALSSALIFALAHHVGPSGEPFHGPAFFFRSLAGLYFAWLFQMRGFGIAVGAHAGYDILVGILLPTL